MVLSENKRQGAWHFGDQEKLPMAFVHYVVIPWNAFQAARNNARGVMFVATPQSGKNQFTESSLMEISALDNRPYFAFVIGELICETWW